MTTELEVGLLHTQGHLALHVGHALVVAYFDLFLEKWILGFFEVLNFDVLVFLGLLDIKIIPPSETAIPQNELYRLTESTPISFVLFIDIGQVVQYVICVLNQILELLRKRYIFCRQRQL